MIAWPVPSGAVEAGGSGDLAADSKGIEDANDGSALRLGATVAGGIPVGRGVGTLTIRMLPAASPSAPTTATASWWGERTTALGGAPSSSGAGLEGTRSAQPVLWSGQAWSTSAKRIEYWPSPFDWTQATRSASGAIGVAPGGGVPKAMLLCEPVGSGPRGIPDGRSANTRTIAAARTPVSGPSGMPRGPRGPSTPASGDRVAARRRAGAA